MVINTNIDLVGMYEDSLCFQIGPSKGEKEGSSTASTPFMFVLGPNKLAICPVLAFAKHLLCNPCILSGKCKLFEGSNQYDQFNAIFCKILNLPKHRERFVNLQMPPQFFGTHSLQKGTVIFYSWCTASPTIVSIYISANWVLSGMMSHYIHYEAAEDMCVG